MGLVLSKMDTVDGRILVQGTGHGTGKLLIQSQIPMGLMGIIQLEEKMVRFCQVLQV